MTSSDRSAAASSWTADPLLMPKGKAPSYVRTHWDEKAARSFGPWRIADKADPALNQTTASLLTAHDSSEESGMVPVTDQNDQRQPLHDIVETVQAQLSETALNALREEAFLKGIEAGMAKAKAELEQERQHERELLRHLSIELRSLSQDSQRFFDPLKRLSLHLAEQLVRGELQISGHVVNTLIHQCLEQFDHPADKAVVTLNPSDLERLKRLEPSLTQGLELESDPMLHVGSVRVRVNDTVVQDLIEHRLEPLARRLLSQPEAWMNQSSLLNKEKIEVSEVSLPAREWGRTAVDIQDTEAKDLASKKPASEEDPDGL